jgi:group I intron endonuclease
MVYVYFLQDPTVINKGYIGVSKTPNKRYKKHLLDRANTPKCTWIRNLLSDGKKPCLLILDSFENHQDAFVAETELIKVYRQNGYILKNSTMGGEGSFGCTPSQDTRDKIRKSKVGKPCSQATKDKISLANKHRKRDLSINQIVSNKLKGRKPSDNTINAIKVKVDQFDLDGNYLNTWDSIIEASRELNISKTGISKCCNGHRQKAGNFKWVFKTQ